MTRGARSSVKNGDRRAPAHASLSGVRRACGPRSLYICGAQDAHQPAALTSLPEKS